MATVGVRLVGMSITTQPIACCLAHSRLMAGGWSCYILGMLTICRYSQIGDGSNTISLPKIRDCPGNDEMRCPDSGSLCFSRAYRMDDGVNGSISTNRCLCWQSNLSNPWTSEGTQRDVKLFHQPTTIKTRSLVSLVSIGFEFESGRAWIRRRFQCRAIGLTNQNSANVRRRCLQSEAQIERQWIAVWFDDEGKKRNWVSFGQKKTNWSLDLFLWPLSFVPLCFVFLQL